MAKLPLTNAADKNFVPFGVACKLSYISNDDQRDKKIGSES